MELQWHHLGFELSNGVKIEIATNIPAVAGTINTAQAALDNWLARTEEYTSESFVAYINSKTHMSEHKAMTMTDYLKSNKSN